MLKRLVLRLLFNGFGLWLAAELLPGVSYGGDYQVLIIATLIFSVVNAVLRPVLIVLSLPAIILTLGIFTLLINGFLLYLVTILYPPFTITSFVAALLAVVIVWVVNHGLDTILGEQV